MSDDEGCGHDPDYMVCGECCEGMEARIAELEAQLLAASEIVKDLAGFACVCDVRRGYTCDFHRRFGADPWVHVGAQAQWARKVVAKIAELEALLAKARAALVKLKTMQISMFAEALVDKALDAIDQEPSKRQPLC
jgi:hypothetical protein